MDGVSSEPGINVHAAVLVCSFLLTDVEVVLGTLDSLPDWVEECPKICFTVGIVQYLTSKHNSSSKLSNFCGLTFFTFNGLTFFFSKFWK